MSPPQRVVVLGLDGVPFPLLQSLFDAGVMPRLAEVARAGTFVPMETTLPAVSSVAWTSFMTGENPGEHGIFGFTEVQQGRIGLDFPSFDSIRCPVLWQQLPGRFSVVVNLPFTYPARPLAGILIAGFVAPVFERAVYPDHLVPWLRSKHYRIDVDSVRGRTEPGVLINDLFETLNVQEEVMTALIQREPWDLFIGVVTGTDRLHHFFFDAHADVGHRFHGDFIDYYRRVDSFFGRITGQFRGDERLIVLSDHGFTRLKTQVYLNHLLSGLGYLKYTRQAPQSLEDIHPGSRAFALDPTRIYLNSRERFQSGLLAHTEAEEVLQRLKHDLASLRLADAGIGDSPGASAEEPLFAAILARDELYSGRATAEAPDLVIVPRRGYDVKAAVNVTAPTFTDIFTGMHTHDDAFLIVNDPTASHRLANARITDVAGLVQEVLGGRPAPSLADPPTSVSRIVRC